MAGKVAVSDSGTGFRTQRQGNAMPRKSQRGEESQSTGALVISALCTLLVIGASVGLVIVKHQRRVARNQENAQSTDNRGGGSSYVPPAPQPVTPFPQNPPHDP